jgi:hypothetical protein
MHNCIAVQNRKLRHDFRELLLEPGDQNKLRDLIIFKPCVASLILNTWDISHCFYRNKNLTKLYSFPVPYFKIFSI